MKEKILKERGITLIALIVTIIVLLILAGITIRVVINTGVLNNTEKATDVYEEKTIREAISVKITKYEINSMNETTKDYFGYLQKEGIITEIEGVETEEKGKKAEVNTQTLIKTKTKRKYYIYENGELYVEILKSDAEKYIGTLWDENGVIQFQEETVGYLIENGLVHEGDYFNYHISNGTSTYKVWKGTEDEFELPSESLRWKVLSIDETNKKLTLITEKPTSNVFIIPEGKTDEDAITELNNACDALYGDGEHECRNLDVNDFSTDNAKLMTLVKGNGNENFYYNTPKIKIFENKTEKDNRKIISNYFTMLVTNSINKLCCYGNESDKNHHEETNFLEKRRLIFDDSNDPRFSHINYYYLPIRPVMILDEDTEIISKERPIEDLIDEGLIEVGDYIYYNEADGTSTYKVWEGTEDEFELTSERLRWRVLSIDEVNKKLTLITEKPTNKGFIIPEGKTDEQAINELNKACDALYGDGEHECRNLDVNDFSANNAKIMILVNGNGREGFYYNTSKIKRYENRNELCDKSATSNYFSMLITNLKDVSNKKLYCISNFNDRNWENETNLIEQRRWNRKYSSYDEIVISCSYLPMRPVLILDGDTEINFEVSNNSNNPLLDLMQYIKIGDYVQYNMSTERSCDFYEEHLESEELLWRVLSIDEENEKITLITEKPATAELQVDYGYLESEVVDNLNEACDTLYGDGFSECRNLSVDDFYYDEYNNFNNNKIEEIIIGNGNEKFYYWKYYCNYFHQSIVNRS